MSSRNLSTSYLNERSLSNILTSNWSLYAGR